MSLFLEVLTLIFQKHLAIDNRSVDAIDTLYLVDDQVGYDENPNAGVGLGFLFTKQVICCVAITC